MPQSNPATERMPHHRAPRVWPTIRRDPMIVPFIKPESSPQLTSLFVTGASVLGIGMATLFLRGSGGAAGGLGLGMLAVSGATAVVSGGVAIFQFRGSSRRNGQLLQRYTAELDRLFRAATRGADPNAPKEGEIHQALREEAEARRANDLPLVTGEANLIPDYTLPPDVAPTRVDQVARYPGTLWQRRPSDPDFLTVRVGAGEARPRTQVQLSEKSPPVRLPDRNKKFAALQQRAVDQVDDAQTLHGVPIVVPLRAHASVGIIAQPPRHETANDVARAILGQIALLHSPYEAQIIVIAPASRAVGWNWVKALPAGIERPIPALIEYGAPDAAKQVEQLHAMLTQREQRIVEHTSPRPQAGPQPPHLVIMLDTQPTNGQLTSELLSLAPIALALRRGVDLGVTVISTHFAVDMAPAQCTLLLDPYTRQARTLLPDAPEVVTCATMDGLTSHECEKVNHRLSRFAPQRDGERELPPSVDLLELFSKTPLDPGAFEGAAIDEMWANGPARLGANAGAFSIPIGRTTAPEPLLIDFLRDGPHGLLIGKTGSGKSELLRSIIAALAMLYSPDQVNFVLVDYKGGLGLDAYAKLPHTLAFLTNLQQPGQVKRFLDMLKSEMKDRQERRKAKQPMPRLFVIIDEFAEMVTRRGPTDTEADMIMDQMLGILRLGRQLDVHLLFAAQRPESAFAKLRGYVQYRISLRTDSEDDSKEIIGRPDAALLPAAYPGRGYLLRGDYQLQEFQAARVALDLSKELASQQSPLDPAAPKTNDELIVQRIAKHRRPAPGRWPAPLPTPEAADPTPLVLYLHGHASTAKHWGSAASMPRRPAEMMAPVGWYDRPIKREQNWFNVDLLGHQGPMHGGPMLVMGDRHAGKTTTLQTLMLFFTTQYSPDELRVYAIDPLGAFEPFEAMRHAYDVREPAENNIIDGASEAEFEAWRARLQHAMELDRSARPRLLVLVDDFDEVTQQLGKSGRNLQELAQELIHGRPTGRVSRRERRRDRGIYLVASTTTLGPGALPNQLFNAMSTKIMLHMNKPESMAQMLGVGRLPVALEMAPGRGFAQTRSSLDQIQVAAPVYGESEVERVAGIQEILKQTPWRVSQE